MTATVTLTGEQRNAFREGVESLLYRLRTDDLIVFDADPWGTIRQLSACALAFELLGGDPRAESYELTVTPEIRECAVEVSRYSREALEDCRVDLMGRPGRWSEEDRQQFVDGARVSVDGYLDMLAVAEQVEAVA